MAQYNNYTEDDLIQCLNVLKLHEELTAPEWAEKLGYKSLYRFTYLRRKTMTYFEQSIQVIGQKRATRYRYVESLEMESSSIEISENENITKLESNNGIVIGTWGELENLIEELGCNFKGECNLREIKPLYCAFCSHQVRIPIPETVKSNRTISKLETKLNKLKMEEVC